MKTSVIVGIAYQNKNASFYVRADEVQIDFSAEDVDSIMLTFLVLVAFVILAYRLWDANRCVTCTACHLNLCLLAIRHQLLSCLYGVFFLLRQREERKKKHRIFFLPHFFQKKMSIETLFIS